MVRGLIIAFLFLYTSTSTYAQFAGGTGTEEDPYQVSTIEQLQEIRNHTDKHFIQINDIDASATEFWNDGKGFEPIGDVDLRFFGTYNGNGYDVSSLYINRLEEMFIGLFGYTSGAKLQNISLKGLEISGSSNIGGIAGRTDGGSIKNSITKGNIFGTDTIGGLVGHNGSVINNSSSQVVVTGSGSEIGGFVGLLSGTINNSYATGNVLGENAIGGLIGYVSDGNINNSYATGNVAGNNEVGGLIGKLPNQNSIISTCFSTGLVSGSSDIGGLIGLNATAIESSYWDMSSSEQEQGIGRGSTGGVTGLTTVEMTGINAFENMSGFDFNNTWVLTNGYPALYWEDVDALPSQIVLNLPENISSDIPVLPTFKWMKDKGATSYQLQVSQTNNFTVLAIDATEISDTTYSAQAPLLFNTSYYWRVRGFNQDQGGFWSDLFQFTTAPERPDVVTMSSPINEAENIDVPVTFIWHPSERAENYNLRIFDSQTSTEPVFQVETADTLLDWGVLGSFETYFWEVLAENPGGQSDSPDFRWSFTTNLASPLALYPENESIGINRYTQFIWSKVDIANSYELQLSLSESFEEVETFAISDTLFVPGKLESATTYYWRVVAFMDEHSSTQGAISSFTTGIPIISILNENIDFGPVSINEEVKKFLLLENIGSDSLFIVSITSGSDAFSSILQAGEIASGEEFQSEITFKASEPGFYEDWITVTDELGHKDSVYVSGFVSQPLLTFSTDTLIIESTRISELKKTSVTLQNSGNDTLRITAVLSNSIAFASSLNNFELLPGEEILDEIEFAPTLDSGSFGQLIYRQSTTKADTLYLKGNIVPIAAELENILITNAGDNSFIPVNISAESSLDPDGGELDFRWVIPKKDSEIIGNEAVLHFDAPTGTSEIQLIVKDEIGATDTSYVRVDILSNLREMQAGIDGGITAFGEDDTYQLFVADISFISGIGSNLIRMNKNLEPQFSLTVPQSIRTAASVSSDSSVFITNGPNLSAFSRAGIELWSTKGLGALARATPTLDNERGRIYVGVSNNNFLAYEIGSGVNSWVYNANAPISASAVITRDSKLIFPTEAGTLYGFDLKQNLSGTSVMPQWQTSIPDSIIHAPAIDSDDRIVVGTLNGSLLKLNFGSAGLVNTMWQSDVCNRVSTSPVIDADGQIYVSCSNGSLYKIDGETGDKLWELETSGDFSATPAISDFGRIYTANLEGELFAVSSNGDIEWYYVNEAGIQSDILHINGTTYIGTNDGLVIAFYDGGGAQLEENSGNHSKSITPRIPQWGTYMGNNQRTGVAGEITIPTTIENHVDIPELFFLNQNYPNPFNPSTNINYGLTENTQVRLEVYNMMGQKVAELVNTRQNAGVYTVNFNASALASGVYFYRLQAGNFVQTQKMILVK